MTTRNGMYRYKRWIPKQLRSTSMGSVSRQSFDTRIQAGALDRAAVAEREYLALVARAANEAGLTGSKRGRDNHAGAASRLLRAVSDREFERIEAAGAVQSGRNGSFMSFAPTDPPTIESSSNGRSRS